jgi:predicted MFS family arabinose efflux permease
MPAVVALSYIRPEEIDYARARNASPGERARQFHRVIDLAKNHPLVLFAGCLVLFQFTNASILPLIGEGIAASGAASGSLRLSGLIIASQVVVAVLAPWAGYISEQRGRKPLLLVGIGLVAVRALLLAFAINYPSMVLTQLLDGITGAIMNVLTVLIITDLTAGSGRFNLAQGVIASMMGAAAALSVGITGFVFQEFGHVVSFLAIAGVAAAAAAMAWIFLPETKPGQYQD